MRQIFLDTETTGLYPDQGHRIIEIAAVESINRRLTGQNFHVYLNPEREIDFAAQEVHGITFDFLQDKPLFAERADDFCAFIQDAELIIHNAPFDVGFLDAELGRIGLQPVRQICANILDTLKMAKEARPGQRNNLDALCKHYGIDNARRTLHGALLDAELLAEVYFAMTRGQDSLMMDLAQEKIDIKSHTMVDKPEHIKVLLAAAEEVAAHEAYIQSLMKSGAKAW
ncbi:MAG TPA: DNA polymerase III subunit epsilon [Methylophilus sp.]|nr:DNA polymerase III subunit epsilon [Methylophilus sp.]HQQ34125.1 DNA polymerase III subunit epsilon [Methylophilus sp.]